MYKNNQRYTHLKSQENWKISVTPLLTGLVWIISPVAICEAQSISDRQNLSEDRINLSESSKQISSLQTSSVESAKFLALEVPSSGQDDLIRSLRSVKTPSQNPLKLAQAPVNPLPPGRDVPPPQDVIPPTQPQLPENIPQQPTTPLPPPEELLNSPTPQPSNNEPNPEDAPSRIFVKSFVIEGSTVFKPEKFQEILKDYTNRELSFTELLQARSQVTKLYVDNGYVTTGAIIPPQSLTDGVVTIRVVEGGLEAINVSGLRRLNSGYVRSRLARSTRKPVNLPKVLEALRVLQLNPLIENLSAELTAGSRPGTNVLEVRVKEADTFSTQIVLDNGRSPSVGSFRRRIQVNEANLLGLGDGISIGYTNTDGSNGLDVSYSLPVNARNGAVSFSYGTTSSNVIEEPFNDLDIISDSRYYELTYRQPIFQSPAEEFTVGFTASRRESETSLLDTPFPLSQGADDEGRTRVSALRFFQEWSKRDSTQVLAARSQFNIGVGAFDATINDDAPDSRFYMWRGQAQWVRLLAPDTLFLVRGDVQLADRPLLGTEQFGLGGLGSVRGYRQDFLLTDNGAVLAAEVRVPVWKRNQNMLQVIPFFDFGTAWNQSGNEAEIDKNTLASLGVGLQLSLGNSFNARIDYGIPLISVDSRKSTWQENGIYFTISTTPF